MQPYRHLPIKVQAMTWNKVGDHPAVNAYGKGDKRGWFPRDEKVSMMVFPGHIIVADERGNLIDTMHKEAFDSLYEPYKIGMEVVSPLPTAPDSLGGKIARILLTCGNDLSLVHDESGYSAVMIPSGEIKESASIFVGMSCPTLEQAIDSLTDELTKAGILS